MIGDNVFEFGAMPTVRSKNLPETSMAENDTADQAAFRSNDFTSPPTYDRTSILSRDNLRTAFGAFFRIGGR